MESVADNLEKQNTDGTISNKLEQEHKVEGGSEEPANLLQLGKMLTDDVTDEAMDVGGSIKKIEVNGLNLELSNYTYNKLNILKSDFSIKKGKNIDWTEFINSLLKLERKNKTIIELKKDISSKKNKELSWDEFFIVMLDRIRIKTMIIDWAYTVSIFIAITLILIFPWFIFGIATNLSFVIPFFLMVGIISAFVSAYLITPFTLRKYKPFDDPSGELNNIVQEFSKKLGIKKKVKLMIADTSEINAMTWSSLVGHKICLTQGLVDSYNNGDIAKDDIHAIIGHEFGHIKNNDTFRTSFVLSIVSIFNMIGTFLMMIGSSIAVGGATTRSVSRKEEVDIAGLAIIIMGWISIIVGIIMRVMSKIASILSFHLMRRDEYNADRIGAELTTLTSMSNSLNKIDTLNDKLIKKELASLPYADRWQIEPKNLTWIDKLYSTHPPIPNRVNSLNQLKKNL